MVEVTPLTLDDVLPILADWDQIVETIQNDESTPHLVEVDYATRETERIDPRSLSDLVFPESAPSVTVFIDSEPGVDYFTSVMQFEKTPYSRSNILLLFVMALNLLESLDKEPLEVCITTADRRVEIHGADVHTLFFMEGTV